MRQAEFQVLSFRRPGVSGVLASSRRTFSRHTHDNTASESSSTGPSGPASGRGLVEAGPGQIITVNPGEIHDGAPIGDSPRRWRMLYFDPAVLQELWQGGSETSAVDYEFEAPAFRDAIAAARLEDLFRLYSAGASSEDLPCEESLFLLLSKLGSLRRCQGRWTGFPAQVSEAKRLIDDDPAAPLTLADLARACGLSRFQTLRAFARATGFTPHAHMVQRRIDRARSLISQGTSLVNAALAGGFTDQSHMTRVFVRRYGYSPSAYAKTVR
jgi:AraC-like DNA-binding protein